MQNKIKNWEELCNDGENYGGEGKNLSPQEKILFESIKDKKVLKIQDAYLFSKTGKIEEGHGPKLCEMIANFQFIKTISSMILTHNHLGAEGIKSSPSPRSFLKSRTFIWVPTTLEMKALKSSPKQKFFQNW